MVHTATDTQLLTTAIAETVRRILADIDRRVGRLEERTS
jgi:hypothetical protein